MNTEQGWQVSLLYGKTPGNYTVSPDMVEILSPMEEMAKWGETKFGESSVKILYNILQPI